jgi:hypothetical protein
MSYFQINYNLKNNAADRKKISTLYFGSDKCYDLAANALIVFCF